MVEASGRKVCWRSTGVVARMSRLAWIFGDDPLWILSGGTDSFGTFGGVGVGVSV
jgi:hypothetical protein